MKENPYCAFRFLVEIDGVQNGGFQSVSGLERQSKIEPYREGGVNDFEHQFVTLTTYPPLVLKRGLVDTDLWDWHREVIEGRVDKRNVLVTLRDDAGNDVMTWTANWAFPSKWTGPELDAMASNVATESIELVHEGLTME